MPTVKPPRPIAVVRRGRTGRGIKESIWTDDVGRMRLDRWVSDRMLIGPCGVVTEERF